MPFLNPLYLLGLTALVYPLLLHLFFRRRARVIPFSTVKFLLPHTSSRRTFHRFRNLFLLILRSLLLILLALGMAEPRGGRILPLRRKDVLIVDNSYSLRYGDEWERLKKEVIEFLQDKDYPLFLLTASGEVEYLSPKRLEDRLELIPFYPSPFPLAETLKKAEEILKPYSEGRVILFTDMQRINFQGIKSSYPFPLIVKPVGEGDRENISIKNLRIKVRGTGVEGNLELENFGSSPRKIRWKMLQEGKEILQGEVEVERGERKEVSFFCFLPPGWNRGKIVLEEDPLPEDNVWFYAFPTSPPSRILVINGHPSPYPHLDSAYYLTRAINPYKGKDFYLQVEVRERLPSFLKDYPLIILSNPGTLSEDTWDKLKEYLEEGGTLFLSLGENFRKDTLPGEDILPLSLPDTGKREGVFHLISSPLFPFLVGKEDRINFYAYIPLKVKKGEVILRFDTGDPALVRNRVGEGEIYLFTSSWDLSWSDFPLTPYFLPFLHHLISSRIPSFSPRSYFVGDKIKGWEEVKEPEGRTLRIKGRDYYFSKPGIYQLRKGERIEFLAVNASREESNLERIGEKELEKLFPQMTLLGEDKYFPSSRRRGVLLFLLALLILTGELPFSLPLLPSRKKGKMS